MEASLEVPTRGSTAAAISNAVVHVFRDHLGKGPTRAKTYVHEDMISCVLRGGLNRQESALVDAGRGDLVEESRHAIQGVLEHDLVAAVERLTSRKVEAFLSASHLDPDLSLETFLLIPREDGVARAAPDPDPA